MLAKNSTIPCHLNPCKILKKENDMVHINISPQKRIHYIRTRKEPVMKTDQAIKIFLNFQKVNSGEKNR